VFPSATDWYLYPHDELLERVLAETKIGDTTSWSKGEYVFPRLSVQLISLLEPYKIGSTADNPTPAPLSE
jgi:hypothetical protein